MKTFWFPMAIALGVLCAGVPLCAQQTPGVPQGVQVHLSPFTAESSPQLLLDVLVTNRSGKAVPDLEQQAFTVLDNKTPTPVAGFRSHNLATLKPGQVDDSTVIILVLDEVNTPFEQVTYGRDQIERFLKQNQGTLAHPVSLAFLSDSGLKMQTQPSVDGGALVAALAKEGQAFRIVERDTQFGLSQRLQISQDGLDSLIIREEAQPGRKMVIWISPGWPLLSGPNIDLLASQQKRIFQSVVGLSAALAQARITMYSIDPLGEVGVGGERSSFYKNFTKGLMKPDGADLGDLGLQVLATQTGGRAIFGDDTIQSSLNRCVADLEAFYTFSIQKDVSKQPNQFHSIEVKMTPPGLKARTRNGYYAQP